MNGNADLPEIVRAGGQEAVAAYDAFCNNPGLAPATRRVYASQARRFLRWAERRGRTLDTLTENDLKSYRAELASGKSRRAATRYLSPVRCLLAELTQRGGPCPKSQPHGRKTTFATGRQEPSLSVSELKQAVRELGDQDEHSRFFQAGLVLLAPLAIGTMDPAAVADFTGVPEPRVREFAARFLAVSAWRPDGSIEVWSTGAGATSLADLELIEVYFDVCYAVREQGDGPQETANRDNGADAHG
jgi:hypothetical protein